MVTEIYHNMDLVTVTCNRDFQFMLLQAESIQKFLEPCHHWIVINEYEDLDVEKWQNALSKFYTKHTFKILTPDNFKINSLPHLRWHAQQYFKLAISTLLNQDYLILDTKSFFIRPNNLDEWIDTMGSGILHKFGESIDGPPWEGISLHYSKVFNTEPLTHFLFNVPFKVNIDILKKYNRTRNLMDDLYPSKDILNSYFESSGKQLFPSEFILYSYLAREHFNDYKHKDRSFLYVVPAHVRNKNEIEILAEIIRKVLSTSSNKNINTFAFHPLIFNSLTNTHIRYINNWLNKLGFEFQFEYNLS